MQAIIILYDVRSTTDYKMCSRIQSHTSRMWAEFEPTKLRVLGGCPTNLATRAAQLAESNPDIQSKATNLTNR